MESEKSQANPGKNPSPNSGGKYVRERDESASGNVETFEKQLDSFFIRDSQEEDKTKKFNVIPQSNSSNILEAQSNYNPNMANNSGAMNFPQQKHQGAFQGVEFDTTLEKPRFSLQKAFGKFIDNTKTLSKHVMDNANNILPANTRAPSPNAQTKSRSTTEGDLATDKHKNWQADISPIFKQTANVIGGLGRNIKTVSGNVFEQFSNVVKNEWPDSTDEKQQCNNLVLHINYLFDNSPHSKVIEDYIRYSLYSQTKYPYIYSHIELKPESSSYKGAENYIPSTSISAVLENSKAVAKEQLSIIGSPSLQSSKNHGVIVVSQVCFNNDERINKQVYTFFTLLNSNNEYKQMTSLNFTSTLPVPGRPRSPFISNTIADRAIDVTVDAVVGEIYKWMVDEYIAVSSKDKINQNISASPVQSQTHSSPRQGSDQWLDEAINKKSM